MEPLARKKCVHESVSTRLLDTDEAQRLLTQLDSWTLDGVKKISKRLRFEDWSSAQAFCNVIGDLSEAEDHHPDLHLGWGRLGIEIWTHQIDGLSEKDFILAAKIDELARDAAGRH